jgi:hypothetical protein
MRLRQSGHIETLTPAFEPGNAALMTFDNASKSIEEFSNAVKTALSLLGLAREAALSLLSLTREKFDCLG